ncbi:MAG: ROK family protein [Gaiellaceae bacterium]
MLDLVRRLAERGLGVVIISHNLHDVFYHGASGIAGELGHVQVRPDGAVCRCGSRGCLETVASTGALVSLLKATHGSDLTLRELLELVSDGDLAAKRVVNDAGRAVGRAVADLCNYLNPAAVIGGVREEIDRYALPGAAQAVEVKAGVLGDRAQMLGALAVVIADTSRLRSAGLTPLNV